MKNMMSTVAVIGAIAVATALAFLVPKGFQFSNSRPIATSAEIGETDAKAGE